MKKKIFLLLAIVAALTLVFVACTEPETPEETTPTVTDAPTDAPTEAPTDEPTEAPTDDATEEVTTEEVTTEEVTTEEMTTEAVILLPNHHASVDHVMGQGPNGTSHYTGMGASTVWAPNLTYLDFAVNGHTVGADGIVTIGGWCCVDGGIAKYVYSVNDGEWMDAVGGVDGEPEDGHFASLGMPDSFKNALFQDSNMLKADLTAYAGQTVTLAFGAIPEADQSVIVPMVTMCNVAVPDGAAVEPDQPSAPTAEPLVIDISKTTVNITDEVWIPYKDHLGVQNATTDIYGQIGGVNAANNNYLGETGYGNIITGGSISVGTVDLSKYSSVTLVAAVGVAGTTAEAWVEDANGNKLNQTNATLSAGDGQVVPTHTLRTVTIQLDSDYNGDVRLLFTQNNVVTVVGITFNP